MKLIYPYNHYLYPTWSGMMSRCYDPNAESYCRYGAKGIKVCPQWHDARVFLDFCDVVLGKRPPGFTLDRIDPYSSYEPSNCRWASHKTQTKNRRFYASR